MNLLAEVMKKYLKNLWRQKKWATQLGDKWDGDKKMYMELEASVAKKRNIQKWMKKKMMDFFGWLSTDQQQLIQVRLIFMGKLTTYAKLIQT